MTEVARSSAMRLAALRRFAAAITILNIVGHLFLGFEQSWAQPFVAVATAYGCELLFESVSAACLARPPQFLGGGITKFISFLLPAHITGLAVSMLLYANDRLWPVAFASAAAVASKVVFRVPIGKRMRHFLNPSNFGISLTLVLFSWVGIAPPYHFAENLDRIGDWVLPAIIIISGSFLNARLTHRIPLILAWIGGFAGQAILRSMIFGTPLLSGLLPMTGMAFILFTFYMITDPATTPQGNRAQAAFGASVAFIYGLLMICHVVFGFFFALSIVCILRGSRLYLAARLRAQLRDLPVPSHVIAKEA